MSSGSWRSCKISSANPATLLVCPVQVRASASSLCLAAVGSICTLQCCSGGVVHHYSSGGWSNCLCAFACNPGCELG